MYTSSWVHESFSLFGYYVCSNLRLEPIPGITYLLHSERNDFRIVKYFWCFRSVLKSTTAAVSILTEERHFMHFNLLICVPAVLLGPSLLQEKINVLELS